jgi:hypothetical protein
MKQRFAWETLDNEALLDLRLCDLGVAIEGTWIEECLATLHAELERRELTVRPHAWLSTQWFTPRGIPGIGIPFYLAHPRLLQLERKQMTDVEGSRRVEMMKILRHETGHVLDNAYALGKDARVRQTFGRWTKRYPQHYTPNPASKRYVQHLRLYYAQAHPHEDFAETFAVILGARGNAWRKRYAHWPALQKLELVNTMLDELRGKTPKRKNRRRRDAIDTNAMTLREYYAEKHERYDAGFPGIYDDELKRLFSDDPKHRHRELASHFLRRNRGEIRKLVSNWTGDYQYTRDQVLHDMIGRSRELKLRATGPERRLKMEFAILLTVKTMDVHLRRRNSFAL